MTSSHTSMGVTTLPATAAGVVDGQLWAQLDPLHASLLAMFNLALKAELDGAWQEVAKRFPSLQDECGNATVSASTYHRTPSKTWLPEVHKLWPLLTLERSGPRKYSDHTLGGRKKSSTWHCHWGLPPLSADVDAAVAPIFQGVEAVIDNCVENGSHPAYNGGASILPTTGLIQMDVTGSQPGATELPGPGEAFAFQFVEIEIITLEHTHVDVASVGSLYTGMDVIAGLGDAKELLPAFAIAST